MTHSLQYVTKKLQIQKLNESANKSTKINNEDRDSGTESDDEQTFDETDFGSEMSSEISSGCSLRSRPTSQNSTDTLTCEELPIWLESPEMPLPVASSMQPHAKRLSRHSQHSYLLRTQNVGGVPLVAVAATNAVPSSGICASDDYEGGDMVEHHSSEEELETLTGPHWTKDSGSASEKRKWSQVARISLTDSGSSDDEISVLTTGTQPPVKFRTSPPLEVHKPLRSKSPPSKMLSVSLQRSTHHAFNNGGGGRTYTTKDDGTESVVEIGTRAASPRKRHRHTPRHHRPCLDFEKMQQMKNRAVTQWRNGGELSLSFF